MQWRDFGALATIFGGFGTGTFALVKSLQIFRRRPRNERTAKHLFANGQTEEIVEMIDQLRSDRRADRQLLYELRRQVEELRKNQP